MIFWWIKSWNTIWLFNIYLWCLWLNQDDQVYWRMSVYSKSIACLERTSVISSPVMRNHQHIRWSLWQRATHIQNAGWTLAECWFDAGRAAWAGHWKALIKTDPEIERSESSNAALGDQGLNKKLCKVQEPYQLVLNSDASVNWPKLWYSRLKRCNLYPERCKQYQIQKIVCIYRRITYMIIIKTQATTHLCEIWPAEGVILKSTPPAH